MKQQLIVMLGWLAVGVASGRAADVPFDGAYGHAQIPIAGTHWRAVELAGKRVPKLPAGSEPHLVFDATGRLAGSDGCNRVIGSYEVAADAITFEQMAGTRMACVDETVTQIEAAFDAALKQAATFRVAGDRLELLNSAGERVARFEARAKEPPPSSVTRLERTSWQLVRFEGGDEAVLMPGDPSKYTITFGVNGRLTAQIDCNRGRGRWRSEGESLLRLGPLSMTRAKCPEGSLHDQIVKQWPNIRSYVIRDGHLFLALMADGGIYEFEPLHAKER